VASWTSQRSADHPAGIDGIAIQRESAGKKPLPLFWTEKLVAE
jgi:hypothetical protein